MNFFLTKNPNLKKKKKIGGGGGGGGGEGQICKCAKLFLKSMHKCTGYGPDKLNICPF